MAPDVDFANHGVVPVRILTKSGEDLGGAVVSIVHAPDFAPFICLSVGPTHGAMISMFRPSDARALAAALTVAADALTGGAK
jgi:hypothetical protein